MKVLILSEDFPPNVGGIAQWAFGVANGFSRACNQVSIITRYFPKYGKIDVTTIKYNIIYIEKKHWKKLRSFYWNLSLKKFINIEYRPDYIISTTWNCSRSIAVYCKKRKIPLITVVHGLDVTRKINLLKKKWLIHTLKNSFHIISVSRFTKEFLVSKIGISRDTISVIPNGVDSEKFYPLDITNLKSKYNADNNRIILTLARVIERKGHDIVIKALPKVISKIPNIKYLICGPWHETYYLKLVKLIESLNLKKYVIFTNRIEDEELNIYYNIAEIYIMLSQYDKKTGDSEGFGITYLEANACEKPVIGGKSGGVEDAVVNGETGFLIEPENINEVADKLILLLENPELANEMGEKGRKRILNKYTWDIISQNIKNDIFINKN